MSNPNPEHTFMISLSICGIDVLVDENDNVFSDQSILLGTVAQRGDEFAWQATDSAGNVFASGVATFEDREDEPALHAILEAQGLLPEGRI